MTDLSQLSNTTRPYKRRKLLGRGIGSGSGKTCGRGQKGEGARSGSKRRWGREGGQMRLFMKTPIRGFSNFNFRKRFATVNLDLLDKVFQDNETVNEETLRARGLISGNIDGIKILGNGVLTKKVKIEAHAISSGAQEKLQKAQISFTLVK